MVQATAASEKGFRMTFGMFGFLFTVPPAARMLLCVYMGVITRASTCASR